MLPAHRTVSRLYSRVSQSLWRSSATTGVRAPLSPLSPLLAGGGVEPMVGTRTGVLPCLWCGLKGAPLYLGDSGDGDDAHDADIRAYSRQGTHLYFVRPLPFQLNPKNPTRRASSPVPMRSLRQPAASGLSNPLHSPTPLPDDGPPLSSGL